MQGFLQYPSGQGFDQAALLRQGNELVGCDRLLPVWPTDQGLVSNDLSGLERQLGLQVQRQSVVVDGVPEFGHQSQAFRTVGIPGRLVVGNAPVPGSLRAFGNHGATDQGVGVCTVFGIDRDPELRRQWYLHTQEIHRVTDFLNAAKHCPGGSFRFAGINQKGKGLWIQAGYIKVAEVALLKGNSTGNIPNHRIVVFGGQFQDAIAVAVAQGLGH